MTRFTIRNLGAVALFLAGTTWLWLAPGTTGRSVSTSATPWAVTRVASLLTLAGFTIATWGLFSRSSWWEAVALAAVAVGLVAVIPYAVAASRDGEPVGATAWNMLTHVMMVAGVFVLLLVPQLEGWVDHHVMGG